MNNNKLLLSFFLFSLIFPQKNIGAQNDEYVDPNQSYFENYYTLSKFYKTDKIYFFEHTEYGGIADSITVGHNISDSRQPSFILGNDNISSFTLPPATCVELFEHINYQGRVRTYCNNSPEISGVSFDAGQYENDQLSSVKSFKVDSVDEKQLGKTVTFWQHDQIGLGTSATFTSPSEFSDARNLSIFPIGNDGGSSFELDPRTCVTIYQDTNFSGWAYDYCNYSMTEKLFIQLVNGFQENDNISSAKIWNLIYESEVDEQIDEIYGFIKNISGFEGTMPEIQILPPSEFEYEISKDYVLPPEEEAEVVEFLLRNLTLVDPDFSFQNYLTDGSVDSSTIGVYLPESDKILIKSITGSKLKLDPYERSTLAHELYHALQNKNTTLLEDIYSIPDEYNDEQLSILAVIEGSASNMQTKYESSLSDHEKAVLENLNTFILESIDYPDSYQKSFPYYPLVSFFKYYFGEKFIDYIESEYGYSRLNDLYQNLPDASLLVLYPEFYDFDNDFIQSRPDYSEKYGDNLLYETDLGYFGLLIFIDNYLEFAKDNGEINVPETTQCLEGFMSDKVAVVKEGDTRKIVLDTFWNTKTNREKWEDCFLFVTPNQLGICPECELQNFRMLSGTTTAYSDFIE